MYPTKDEILAFASHSPPEHLLVETVKHWKDAFYTGIWGDSTQDDKQEALDFLVYDIWHWWDDPIKPKLPVLWIGPWAYNPNLHVIHADPEKPSIISAMHEVGHAIHGESELYACGFSVGLFKKCFPIEFSKLKWQGHLLVKE